MQSCIEAFDARRTPIHVSVKAEERARIPLTTYSTTILNILILLVCGSSLYVRIWRLKAFPALKWKG